MTAVPMSDRELNRLEVLSQIQSGRLQFVGACSLIGVCLRQV